MEEPSLIREIEAKVFGPVYNPGELPAQLAASNGQLESLTRLLLAEVTSGEEPGSALVADSLVRTLIIQLLRHHKHGLAPPEAVRAASADPRVARVLSFMREHFAEKITIDQLVALNGTSQSSFSLLFREAVGQSAYQHLLALRLEHALKLLEGTMMSVTEVAYESGFGQPTHFATLFHERFGVGPRAWRRANTLLEAPTVIVPGEAGLGDERTNLSGIRK